MLLVVGLLVLAAISASSVFFVNRARDDSALVTHTVEVENQINTVLLELRRAESALRGYLLTSQGTFLAEHERAVANIKPGLETLTKLTSDNPAQVASIAKLKPAIDDRLAEFAQGVDFVKRNDTAGGISMLRDSTSETVQRILAEATAMRAEEEELFFARTISADRSQQSAALITIAGSGMVVALAGISIFLVRRSNRAQNEAEALLRDNNINLEATVEERTSDLREANEEIQRFAYIVSHDLRSPLINIMGFTSELEELRNDIFRRIASLSRPSQLAPPAVEDGSAPIESLLDDGDKQLSEDFTEALGFIKSSISKMDRLISAILNLTREGRREFVPEPIEMHELIEAIVTMVTHQAVEANAQIRIEPLPDIVSDRLAVEQIFSNLIDNALKYLKDGVPGEIVIRGRRKLGFVIFDVTDNGRGIGQKDHQRIFDLFRRAGSQNRPGQGIGLAHVRALVRRLGGTISVHSELDQGSTFTITLPATWTGLQRDKQA